MLQIFKRQINVDWLALRRIFMVISIALMLAGLVSSVARNSVPGGTDAFNLGVDFKGGTLFTVNFNQRPAPEQLRSTLNQSGINEADIQPVTSDPRQMLIKLPQATQTGSDADDAAQVNAGRAKVVSALATFGKDGEGKDNAQIVSTEAVGPVASNKFRNDAIVVTLLALVGMLMYIAFRFEWTYGAAAVITVFHDVLVTLGIFSIMQWEVNLTVIAALLTLVGYSVNDTIVTFDRVRENLRLNRRGTLYDITNDAINQTLSRTIITGGLVFLSVVALVIFGGEVLRGFSLALLIGTVVGTYSTIAISNPIMVWWQQRLEAKTGSAAQTAPSNVSSRAAANNARRAVSAGNAARKARTTPAR